MCNVHVSQCKTKKNKNQVFFCIFLKKFLKYLKTLQIAHIQWILARSNFYININLGKITKIFFTCFIKKHGYYH